MHFSQIFSMIFKRFINLNVPFDSFLKPRAKMVIGMFLVGKLSETVEFRPGPTNLI